MIVTAPLFLAFALVAMVLSYWAGRASAISPSEQNEAWLQEGYAAAETYIPMEDCPYREARQANPTAFAFWRQGYKRFLDRGPAPR